MARSLGFACVLFVLLGSTFADEFHGPSVVDLTSSDYDSKVSDGRVYFIKYYAPWCGHCKRLAETWKELGTSFKDTNVVVAHVDCTTSRDVCQTADVKGYPTLKVIHKGEEYKSYRGARELSALKTFISEAAKELTSEL